MDRRLAKGGRQLPQGLLQAISCSATASCALPQARAGRALWQGRALSKPCAAGVPGNLAIPMPVSSHDPIVPVSPMTTIDAGLDEERGRDAESPTDIGWEGWKDILWRVWAEFDQDRITLIAAGATFYILLALFPALAAFVSIYGFVADPVTIADHIAFLAGFLPSGGVDLIKSQLQSLASQNEAALSVGFVFGLLVALWSANNGIKTLFEAMNVAYDETEKRSFVRLNLDLARFYARRHCDRHPLPRQRRGRAGGARLRRIGERDRNADRAAALADPFHCHRSSRCLSSTATGRAAPAPNGDGSPGEASSQRHCGCSPRCSSPGTSRTSPTTTRPTARLVP